MSLGVIFTASDSVAALQVGASDAPAGFRRRSASARACVTAQTRKRFLCHLTGSEPPCPAHKLAVHPASHLARLRAQILDADATPLVYSLVFGEGVVNDASSIVLLRAVQKIR